MSSSSGKELKSELRGRRGEGSGSVGKELTIQA